MLTMRRVTKATELKRFKELEGEYHYMGETHSGGDTMRLVFEEDGKWVALMVWGSACYHLKPRDAYIGWANSTRAERHGELPGIQGGAAVRPQPRLPARDGRDRRIGTGRKVASGI